MSICGILFQQRMGFKTSDPFYRDGCNGLSQRETEKGGVIWHIQENQQKGKTENMLM